METNPNKLLCDNYEFNRQLVNALIELLPNQNRVLIEKWMTRFQEMCHSAEQILHRSQYLWFLVLVLQKQNIAPPFDRPPPIGQLKPLHEILPMEVYDDIISCAVNRAESTKSWLDDLIEDRDRKEKNNRAKLMGLYPCNFFKEMPRPREGAIAYGAVFSDFSTTPDMVP